MVHKASLYEISKEQVIALIQTRPTYEELFINICMKTVHYE